MPIAPIHDQGDLRETKEIPMRKFRGSGYFDPPDCCGFMILECARYVLWTKIRSRLRRWCDQMADVFVSDWYKASIVLL